ncbi:HNH endonuclease family protein [Corynebacterium bovis]|uniref:HNH endonuclease family protein n=1 Tax=Corynebacterium bovis TaxID=36808 RepID=UPI003CC722EC
MTSASRGRSGRPGRRPARPRRHPGASPPTGARTLRLLTRGNPRPDRTGYPRRPPAPDGAPGPGAVDVAAVRGLLATLPVKGRAPKTGYTREQFGPSWDDVDRNGCDTRNDILARDLRDIVLSGRCKVMSGTLDDPYTGTTIPFVRGRQTSSAVQIDHVVALSDAWQKGAQQLDPVRRTELANDPLNLLAVDGPSNTAKGAGDAATWLPPNTAFRCRYVATQVQVKAKYGLWVTAAERDAVDRELGRCPAG